MPPVARGATLAVMLAVISLIFPKTVRALWRCPRASVAHGDFTAKAQGCG